MNSKLTFRNAERKDIPLILQFIKKLADYEKLLNEIVATNDLLKEWIFDKQKAEVIFAVEDGTELDLPCFFTIFPPFSDAPGSIWKTYM